MMKMTHFFCLHLHRDENNYMFMSNNNSTTKKNTHVAAHYVFMPWQKIVCETQHKLHIHIGKLALSPPIQRVL